MEQSTVRIIGGIYKGRRLKVLEVSGLRPTPDRVREDIFNLLGSKTSGAQILDLFAGSGALGLEALSRGGASLTLVELDRGNYLNLCNECHDLGPQVKVVNADALKFLQGCNTPYDLIFLDPPYQSTLLKESLRLILQKDLLKDGGLVYAEMPAGSNEAMPGFEVEHRGSAGAVSYVLLKKSSFLF